MTHHRKHIALLLFATVCQYLPADESAVFPFPAAPVFSEPLPLVFPGATSAPFSNPSALVNPKNLTWVSFSNSLPVMGTGDYGVVAGLTHSGKSWGASAGYLGAVSNTPSHGGYGAIAGALGKALLGASFIYSSQVTSGMRADAALSLPVMKEMRLTVAFSDLITSQQPKVGLGYRGSAITTEAFVTLPPFSDLASGYSVGASATFAFSRFHLYSLGTYQTLTSTIGYAFGLGAWMNLGTYLAGEFSSSGRSTISVLIRL